MNLIDQINDFFGKDAHIEIKGEYMHITIGNQTLVIKTPLCRWCAIYGSVTEALRYA